MKNSEGIAFTDNYFYAYYRNIDGNPIPFASVYMNEEDSQDVVNEVNKELANVRKGERVKFYFDRVVVRFRDFQNKNNANNGDNQGTSYPVRNSGMVRRLLRKGKYFDRPDLYVKTQRTDRGERGNRLDARYHLKDTAVVWKYDICNIFRRRKWINIQALAALRKQTLG